jgi:hypothetical protein
MWSRLISGSCSSGGCDANKPGGRNSYRRLRSEWDQDREVSVPHPRLDRSTRALQQEASIEGNSGGDIGSDSC